MSELVTVTILGMPLEVMQRSAEHSDELLREFALVREEGGDHVPARMLDLIEELRTHWYLAEFERQIAGQPPRPWPAVTHDSGPR